MIRLFIVDDHPVVADGLAARYDAAEGFSVAGIAQSVSDAVYVAATGVVDIALVDVQLGTLLTPRQVGSLAEHCHVVIYSARATDPYVQQLLAAGAAAAVDKAGPLAQLDRVLRDVHGGRAPGTTWAVPASATRDLLSAREYEVYRALASCQTPKEVAASLGVARSTVYCHIENVRRKLGVETLQEIVARAASEIG